MSPAGMQHEEIGVELTYRIRAFLERMKLGKVFGSSVGYELTDGDVLSPDVSFVGASRFEDGKAPVGFGQYPPDLAVEIVSPTDNLNTVEEKVDRYLRAGTRLVWVVNPKLRRVTIYRADGTIALV